MSAADSTPRTAADLAPAPAPDQPPPATQGGTGTFSPFRSRNFSLLFSGQLISVLGDQVYGLALPWTVLAVTGDARKMAYVLAAEAVPRAFLLLVGGALSDRLSPRVVMLSADLIRMVVVGALGATFLFGLPPLWLIALLAALQGLGSGLFGPGVPALLPRLLPEKQLPAGNGLMQIVQFLTLTIGPVLGGIATAAQATLAFLADAASFGISALTLFGIRLPERADTSTSAAGATERQPGMLRQIGDGISYTVKQPLIRSTMAITIFGNLGFAGALNVALIVLSRALSPSPITFGLMLGAAGVGGIIGGLSSALLGKLPHRGVLALSLFGIGVFVLGATPLVAGSASQLPFTLDLPLDQTGHIAGVAILMALLGLILGLGDTMFLTIMQTRIAPEYLARVFSLQVLAGSIVIPVSLVGAGFLTALYGPGWTFLAGASSLAVSVLIGFFSRAVRRI